MTADIEDTTLELQQKVNTIVAIFGEKSAEGAVVINVFSNSSHIASKGILTHLNHLRDVITTANGVVTASEFLQACDPPVLTFPCTVLRIKYQGQGEMKQPDSIVVIQKDGTALLIELYPNEQEENPQAILPIQKGNNPSTLFKSPKYGQYSVHVAMPDFAQDAAFGYSFAEGAYSLLLTGNTANTEMARKLFLSYMDGLITFP